MNARPRQVRRLARTLLSAALVVLAPAAGCLGQPATPPKPTTPTAPPPSPASPSTPAKPAEKAPEPKPEAKAKTNLENMQAAFSAASKAEELLGSFAAKADEEGYGPAASMLRAAARSQKVHVDLLSGVIKKAGATPTVNPEPKSPAVKTTKENLLAAAKLLREEKDQRLTEYATQARTENAREAGTVFRYEREALTELVRFCQDAADNLPKWKGGKKDFFVDRTCGYTIDKLDIEKCPVCRSKRDSFERVN